MTMSEDSMDREKHCAAHKSKKKKKHKYNYGKTESLGSLNSGNDQRLLHEKKTFRPCSGRTQVLYVARTTLFAFHLVVLL